MNTVKRLVIKRLKRGRVNQVKELHENFGEEEQRRMWKDDYIEKVTPILLNKIYDKRLEVIVNSLSTNPEGVSILKEVIPRICHEETIIPEENLRELFTIFKRPIFLTRNQTFQRKIVKIRELHNFIFRKIAKIMIKICLHSLDDDDDDDFDIWIMSRSFKFREFPKIPDRGVVWWKSYNIYNWFKSKFRQYDDEMALDLLIRLAENKTKESLKRLMMK